MSKGQHSILERGSGAGTGGFQEGHGGGIEAQPFFIEGVREALDAKGEWWVDKATRTLYILPNTTSTTATPTPPNAGASAPATTATPASADVSTGTTDSATTTTIRVVAPRLQTLLSIRGAAEDPAGGSDGAARNITLRGLTFAHSAPTYFEPYAQILPPRPTPRGTQ